ncbi:MAG: S24 family peptidase [Pseudomonadota bacterium]
MNWLQIRKQTFAGYWNGERLPPAHVLLQMAEQLDADPRWLLTGSDDSDGRTRNPLPESRQDRVADRGGDTVEIVEIDLRYGMGATYFDEAPDVQARTFSRAWLRNFTDSPPEELFWARGQGNSMEPTIGEGAIVLIDRRQQSPRMADLIWAFAFGDIGMLKRLRPMPDGSVKILSDNQSVPPETAHDGELHIIGRVVAVVKKL